MPRISNFRFPSANPLFFSICRPRPCLFFFFFSWQEEDRGIDCYSSACDKDFHFVHMLQEQLRGRLKMDNDQQRDSFDAMADSLTISRETFGSAICGILTS